MSGICMEYEWNVYGIRMEYVCLEYAWSMYACAWILNGICRKDAWIMNGGICMQYG